MPGPAPKDPDRRIRRNKRAITVLKPRPFFAFRFDGQTIELSKADAKQLLEWLKRALEVG